MQAQMGQTWLNFFITYTHCLKLFFSWNIIENKIRNYINFIHLKSSIKILRKHINSTKYNLKHAKLSWVASVRILSNIVHESSQIGKHIAYLGKR